MIQAKKLIATTLFLAGVVTCHGTPMLRSGRDLATVKAPSTGTTVSAGNGGGVTVNTASTTVRADDQGIQVSTPTSSINAPKSNNNNRELDTGITFPGKYR